MIIRRLRAQAGIYVSALLLCAGVALANDPVTQSQMRSFVYETVGGAAVLVLVSFWALLIFFNARAERSLEAAITALKETNDDTKKALTDSVNKLEFGIEKMLDGLHLHAVDPLAHPAASEHNHGPMNEQSKRIEQKLDQLILEHRVIRGSEDEVCKFVRSMATASPKRADDPPDFDGTKRRGRA